jgi:integrase
MGKRRNPNLRSTIYKGSDGDWHGRVTVGIRDDGKPDRRHIRGKTRAEAAEKVRKLERDRDRGNIRKAGERWTVAQWLMHWIDNIAVTPRVTEYTHSGYRVDVEKHLIPGIGAHWLDRLEPEHLERLYARIQDSGLSAGTAHHVHRTARNALNEAVRRGKLVRNPASLAKAPALSEEEVEPYDVPEIRRLLDVAAQHRNSARWAVALALGLRQGEALGLKWDDVDLDKGILRIRRSRLRPKYEHGCGGTCGRKAGFCPQRRNTRPTTGKVKSKAGRRIVGLPAQLVTLLRKHRAEQDAERKLARQMWHGEEWVFATPTGQALNTMTDYKQWKALLKAAGLRETRLHDARHTAATVLLILGQPERTVMSLMGWSTTDMAKRYQHVTDQIRAEVASQVDSLIWAARSADAAADAVYIRRDSLAAILPLVEDRLLAENGDDDIDMEELELALADFRKALSAPNTDTQGDAK